MKTENEIMREIGFQEHEYIRIEKILNSELGQKFPELKREQYIEIMGRHAARRESLLWVIDAL